MEPTEREKKLIEHINNLISAMNVLSITFDNLQRALRWGTEALDTMNVRVNEEGLLDFLKEEFGINYELMSYEDFKESKNENSSSENSE